MPTQRLEAAMRPPRAVHLLLVAAVFYLRLVATQSTCCERALVERCLRASLVLEVSPVIHRRNDALRFPKNDTVRLRVHASLKGQLDRTSIFLTRGVYTDEAETQFQRNTRWFVFLQESAFGSPIFTTVGPLLPSTTDNEKQVQAAIRCGRFVPTVKQMRTAKKVRVKKRLMLKCRVAVSGKFPLNITWYRNGRPVKQNPRIVITRLKRACLVQQTVAARSGSRAFGRRGRIRMQSGKQMRDGDCHDTCNNSQRKIFLCDSNIKESITI